MSATERAARIVHDQVCGCRGGKRTCLTPQPEHVAAARALDDAGLLVRESADRINVHEEIEMKDIREP